jgi:hypothetical protein
MHFINDAHYGGIRGHFFWKKRKAGFAAAHPIDQFSGPGARGIDADEAFTGLFEFRRQGLYHEKAHSFHVRIFRSGPDTADYASKEHDQSSRTSSTIPIMAVSTGVSLQPSAMRAELPETARTRSR